MYEPRHINLALVASLAWPCNLTPLVDAQQAAVSTIQPTPRRAQAARIETSLGLSRTETT